MHADAFLRSAAKGQFAPVYLLTGKELYFRDKFREVLVKFFLGSPDAELADHDLAEMPVRDALDDAAGFSLFAPRRVVWLRNADSLLPKRDGGVTAGKHSLDAITGYLARPNDQSIVVFEARLDDQDKITRLEKLLAGCTHVSLERPAAADSARHLTEEAQRGGVTLDTRAAAELVESTGGDLARARMELDKLIAYVGSRKAITTDDVRALVPSEPAFIIWELGDSIGRGDTRGALGRLEALLRDGHKALPTLGLIAGHMRKMLRAKAGSKQWLPPEVKRQAQKVPLPRLVAAMDRLFQADVELRSSPPADRLVLERLIFDLTKGDSK